MLTRTLLVLSLMIFGVAPVAAADTPPSVEVWKSATCECCGAWVEASRGERLYRDGERRRTRARSRAEAAGRRRRQARLLPHRQDRRLCHRGPCAGSDIKRLIAEQPDATGSRYRACRSAHPGMEQGAEFEPYDVLLIKKDGATEVFASH